MGIDATTLNPSRTSGATWRPKVRPIAPKPNPIGIGDSSVSPVARPFVPSGQASSKIWRWMAWGLLVAGLMVSSFLACGGRHGLEFQAEKPVSKHIDGSGVSMIDLRFHTGSIRFTQSPTKEISVEGKIYINTTDQATARLKAEQVDLEVSSTGGRYVLVQLPEKEEDSNYEVELNVAIPKGVDLRLSLGSGEIESAINLPKKTDIQVGSGAVRINLPKETSAQIMAKNNMGDITVDGFDTQSGKVQRQLIYSEFNGAVGTEWLAGNKLDLSVSSGSIVIQGNNGGN